jgi:hypothetical protein
MAIAFSLWGRKRRREKEREKRKVEQRKLKEKKERWEKIWTSFELAYKSHTQEQEEKYKGNKKGPLQTSK